VVPKEIIVVEGKDDEAAVKKACQAEVIITNGLGITKKTLQQIKVAQERCGVIILTDPDYPGEKIRRIIDSAVPGCRHAYLYQQEKGKIGVEYASSEEIMESLAQAHLSQGVLEPRFKMEDLYTNRLIGYNQARERRFKLGCLLGIGETNGKQFLNRLNAYNITRHEFERALAGLKE
jgi:ribonuclease M5